MRKFQPAQKREVTFTGYICWQKACGVEEEIDVKAANEKEARAKIRAVLNHRTLGTRDFQAGGRIVKLVERLAGEIFF